MDKWGRCLGYTGTTCPNCGRYRLEKYENGKSVCEKCYWCPEDQTFIDREEMYWEEDYHTHWTPITYPNPPKGE